MLKWTALGRMMISLLETGRHLMSVFTMSLWTRNPTPCSCLSSGEKVWTRWICTCPFPYLPSLRLWPTYSACNDPKSWSKGANRLIFKSAFPRCTFLNSRARSWHRLENGLWEGDRLGSGQICSLSVSLKENALIVNHVHSPIFTCYRQSMISAFLRNAWSLQNALSLQTFRAMAVTASQCSECLESGIDCYADCLKAFLLFRQAIVNSQPWSLNLKTTPYIVSWCSETVNSYFEFGNNS